MQLSLYDIIKLPWKEFKTNPHYIEFYNTTTNIALDFSGIIMYYASNWRKAACKKLCSNYNVCVQEYQN